MSKLTIFTPSYNRKEELERAYNSLLNQTNLNFIWMIVDDGSSDGTSDYIKEIQKNAPFNIEYYYQENKGKPYAFNYGVELGKTDYFFEIDSDDWLVKQGVEVIYQMIEKFEGESYSALCFQCEKIG